MFHFSLLSSFIDATDDGYLYEDVWTEYAKELLSSVFMYAAIALAVLLIGIGIFVRYKNAEKLSAFVKTAAALAIGFVVTVIVAMLALEFAHIAEKGYTEYDKLLGLVLVPSIILGGVAVLGIAASYIASLFNRKAFKITLISVAGTFCAALIALIVCLAVYFASGAAEENNGATITPTENAVLYVCAAAIVLAIAAVAFVFGRNEKNGFDSKSIAYAAVCIASSFALSYIKLWSMPQGGSLTLASLLPLMIYSYMFGVRKGVLAGLVYGILQAVQDPWLIHPAQFLLDYPVAFAGIGIAGIFIKIKKLDKLPQVQFALGAVIASVLRFACHVLSGVFAFSEYSTLDNVWLYSLGYNSYVFVDVIIVIVVGALMFSVKSFNKQIKTIQAVALKQEKTAPEHPDDNAEA